MHKMQSCGNSYRGGCGRMYFSPMYWMVPQMVKARPPLSRRRDKPKSARRRCPRTDHFSLQSLSTRRHPDSCYSRSYNWCHTLQYSQHNLISLEDVIGCHGCSLSVPTDVQMHWCVQTDSCAESGCSLEGSVSLLQTVPELCCSLLGTRFYSPLSVNRMFSIYKKVPKRLN